MQVVMFLRLKDLALTKSAELEEAKPKLKMLNELIKESNEGTDGNSKKKEVQNVVGLDMSTIMIHSDRT